MKTPLRVSTLVITRDRPEMLRRCLDSLLAQDYPDHEILVADSSTGESTRETVAGYPGVTYVRVTGADNNMPRSRNVGFGHATGDVIAFVDDDATAHPGWLRNLAACFDHPEVGGAGGRVVEMNRENTVVNHGDAIGRVYPDGRHVGNFTLADGDPLDVDWVPGCNMAWRRSLVEELGGFDEGYTITNACEERDFGIRVRLAGWRILYHPGAGVDHYAAPKQGLKRDFMDPRVHYSVIRNNTYFFTKNYGLTRPFVTAYLLKGTWGSFRHFLDRPTPNRLRVFLAHVGGKLAGVFRGMRRRGCRTGSLASAAPAGIAAAGAAR